MKADRETNRLPLRAGAMVLFAIAVVCILLGSLALTRSDDGDSLEKASESAKASASEQSDAAPSKQPTASKPSKTDTAAGDVPQICVLNVGVVSGLAAEVGDTLKSAGYQVGEVSNYETRSISENTIFYTGDQKAAAEKVKGDVPGGASLTPRPESFTRCPGELALMMVSR